MNVANVLAAVFLTTLLVLAAWPNVWAIAGTIWLFVGLVLNVAWKGEVPWAEK